jgi:hypothetical protein
MASFAGGSTAADIEEAHARACSAGQDMYIDPVTGYKVFTRDAHLRRGVCCGSACRHCPYGHFNAPVEYRKSRINTTQLLRQPSGGGRGAALAAARRVFILPFAGTAACQRALAPAAALAAASSTAGCPGALMLLAVFDEASYRAYSFVNGSTAAASGGGGGQLASPLPSVMDAARAAGLSLVVAPVPATAGGDAAAMNRGLAAALRSCLMEVHARLEPPGDRVRASLGAHAAGAPAHKTLALLAPVLDGHPSVALEHTCKDVADSLGAAVRVEVLPLECGDC